MDSQSISGWLEDKALWVTVLSVILPPISAAAHVNLDPNKIGAMVAIAVTFIVTHKLKSGVILWTEIKQRALALVSDAPAPSVATQSALGALGLQGQMSLQQAAAQAQAQAKP